VFHIPLGPALVSDLCVINIWVCTRVHKTEHKTFSPLLLELLIFKKSHDIKKQMNKVIGAFNLVR